MLSRTQEPVCSRYRRAAVSYASNKPSKCSLAPAASCEPEQPVFVGECCVMHVCSAVQQSLELHCCNTDVHKALLLTSCRLRIMAVAFSLPQVRAGESEALAADSTLTNPVWKTSLGNGLTSRGKAQVGTFYTLQHHANRHPWSKQMVTLCML